MKLLDYVVSLTDKFLNEMPKSVRKKKGQFFTSKETAEFMASLFDLSKASDQISILDPGAGTGILSAALLDRVINETSVESVFLTCYENDDQILPLLKQVLDFIKQQSDVDVEFRIIAEDYILSQADEFEGTILSKQKIEEYDYIIGNPPYFKIRKNSPEATSMPSIIYGAPNIYFLFAAMSLFNLKKENELVYIVPRSWTSGAYFLAFRKYFLKNGKLEQIHLFVSRNKVFKQEKVLQETIIIKVKKTEETPKYVTISSTESNGDFDNITEIQVPYRAVVSGPNLYVFLPTSDNDVKTIELINKYEKTMPEEGIKMHTGIVVDFRHLEDLRKEPEDNTVPLFYSQHIKQGRVNHDSSGKECDWILDNKPGLIQKNQNYVFCKRFTAKEEPRRLQCGIYLADNFPQYKLIGTQNKINYISKINGENMSKQLTYGIYALLNSTLFDKYYRILNGSTQVNSSEVNSIPIPPVSEIEKIGGIVIDENDLSTEACDKAVMGVSYNE